MAKLLDKTDRKILKVLQRDATVSLESIAEMISMSLNTCWRRVQALEKAGIIERRVALVDQDKVGLPLTVFVSVRTDEHSEDWAKKFAGAVESIPQIVEFYRLAGDVDYLLKLTVASVADYDAVYKKLISKVKLSDVSASFAMERLKNTTELYLG